MVGFSWDCIARGAVADPLPASLPPRHCRTSVRHLVFPGAWRGEAARARAGFIVLPRLRNCQMTVISVYGRCGVLLPPSPHDPASQRVYWIMYGCMTALALLCLCVNGLLIANVNIGGRRAIAACQALSRATISCLFFPIVNTLLRSVHCGGSATVVTCVVAVLLLTALSLTGALLCLTVIDRNPLSPSANAQATGRVDAVSLACKLAVSAVAALWPRLLPLVATATALIRLYHLASVMPYMHAWVNHVAMGCVGVYTLSCLGCVASLVSQCDAGPGLVFGAPFAFFAAFLWSVTRHNALAHTSARAIATLPRLEAWIRHRVQAYDKHTASVQTLGTLWFLTRPQDGNNDSTLTQRQGEEPAAAGPVDIGVKASAVSALKDIEAAFDYALRRWPQRPWTLCNKAQFLGMHRMVKCAEATLLREAYQTAVKSGALDVMYAVYAETRRLQEGSEEETQSPELGPGRGATECHKQNARPMNATRRRLEAGAASGEAGMKVTESSSLQPVQLGVLSFRNSLVPLSAGADTEPTAILRRSTRPFHHTGDWAVSHWRPAGAGTRTGAPPSRHRETV